MNTIEGYVGMERGKLVELKAHYYFWLAKIILVTEFFTLDQDLGVRAQGLIGTEDGDMDLGLTINM